MMRAIPVGAARAGGPSKGRGRGRVWAALAVGVTSCAVVAASLSALSASSAAAGTTTQPAGDEHRSEQHVQRDVIANLFEWNWVSIARECTSVLGPKGYGGVQVAPPQDSLSKTDGPVHPWWEVYQPVDYNLTSRMGNAAQFKSMVTTCRKAGVKVYVDAVINHMTGQGDISYGGQSYTKYNYPGLYTAANFHHTPADCPTADGRRQHRRLQQLPAGHQV